MSRIQIDGVSDFESLRATIETWFPSSSIEFIERSTDSDTIFVNTSRDLTVTEIASAKTNAQSEGYRYEGVAVVNAQKIVASGGNPVIQLEETDGLANAKKWRFQVNAGVLKLETLNDAETVRTPRMEITLSSGLIDFKNGNVIIRNSLAMSGSITPITTGEGELGTDTKKFKRIRAAVIAADDIELKGNGQNYTIKETPEGLNLVNNKTNKTYKFLLEEVV